MIAIPATAFADKQHPRHEPYRARDLVHWPIVLQNYFEHLSAKH
jgi:hypothetical protein